MKTVSGHTDHVPQPGGRYGLLEHNGYRVHTGPTMPPTDAAPHEGER
ncbi:hypothetical protein [Streptomyces rimosus]|nr:hypothetical protein [Streptomyces rimosus]